MINNLVNLPEIIGYYIILYLMNISPYITMGIKERTHYPTFVEDFFPEREIFWAEIGQVLASKQFAMEMPVEHLKVIFTRTTTGFDLELIFSTQELAGQYYEEVIDPLTLLTDDDLAEMILLGPNTGCFFTLLATMSSSHRISNILKISLPATADFFKKIANLHKLAQRSC